MNPVMPEVATASPASAVEVMRQDHQQIDRLLQQYELLAKDSQSMADRQGLIARMGALLTALQDVREQVVYPLLKESVTADMLGPVQKDHRLLSRQLQMVAGERSTTASIDGEMHTLADLARAYFAMEEQKLFPHLAKIDSPALGQQVAMLRSASLGDQGAD